MPAPALSVIVPNRNGCELLAECLPPLLSEVQALPAGEVIVVDDGSSDGSVAWLHAEHPAVRVVELAGSAGGHGFAAACNAGAWAAAGDAIVFLNNDATVRPGWAGALTDALAAFPDAVVIGGLTLFSDRAGVVNSAGVRVTRTGAAFDVGLGMQVGSVDLTPREVAAVSGVSMAVRTDWFAATGGFHETLFMYFEDVELCLRAWLEGRSVRFVPDAVVLHRGGASAGGRYEPLRNYYGSRNRLLVAALCLDRRTALAAVPLLIAQDLATVAWLLVNGRWEVALATARDRGRGILAGLWDSLTARRARLRGGRYRRCFPELEAAGLIESWSGSLREFARLRGREARG